MNVFDADIAQWRVRVIRDGAVTPADADELENHLRDQVSELASVGLKEDEAFLIAVKRLGQVDLITAEFARAHSERLWKHLVLHQARTSEGRQSSLLPVVVFAAVAAVLIQVWRLWGTTPDPAPWIWRDVGFFVLPVLVAYLAFSRRLPVGRLLALAVPVLGLAVVVNVYPFGGGSDTASLVAVHVPVVLWFVAGAAYLGDDLRSSAKRMDFIRFSGEWGIYYVLIALGGAVLMGLTNLLLDSIAPGAIDQVDLWVVPSGAAAAVVVAAWLVEGKKNVIENIAPVLTAIFTPLFAVMLLACAVIYAVAGIGHAFDRDLLSGFDILLLVVLALVLYGLSARDPLEAGGLMDILRFTAVVAALALDLLVLTSMLGRIGDMGVTPNRAVALGLNVLLVIDLAVAAWQSISLLRRRVPAIRLERWQTTYLPIIGAWAAVVVLVLPPLFRFA